MLSREGNNEPHIDGFAGTSLCESWGDASLMKTTLKQLKHADMKNAF